MNPGGVAYLAHVGGALTGIFVAFLFYDELTTSRPCKNTCKAGRRAL